MGIKRDKRVQERDKIHTACKEVIRDVVHATDGDKAPRLNVEYTLNDIRLGNVNNSICKDFVHATRFRLAASGPCQHIQYKAFGEIWCQFGAFIQRKSRSADDDSNNLTLSPLKL